MNLILSQKREDGYYAIICNELNFQVLVNNYFDNTKITKLIDGGDIKMLGQKNSKIHLEQHGNKPMVFDTIEEFTDFVKPLTAFLYMESEKYLIKQGKMSTY